jgi:GT2 family glycosyltransferase
MLEGWRVRNSQKMSFPSVHVVILNWNGLDDTLECLASLRKQNYPALKIHVVDNGSVKDEAGIIERQYPEISVRRGDAIAPE